MNLRVVGNFVGVFADESIGVWTRSCLVCVLALWGFSNFKVSRRSNLKKLGSFGECRPGVEKAFSLETQGPNDEKRKF